MKSGKTAATGAAGVIRHYIPPLRQASLFALRAEPGQIKNHRRFVAAAKYLLPLVAVMLVAMVIVWPHIYEEDNRFKINSSAARGHEIDEPSMVNPRYLGVDSSGQPFSITADLARSAPEGDALIELETPKVDIALEDGTWLILAADSGAFNRPLKTLNLWGSVNLFYDLGYEFRTQRAVIDLKAGTATSNVPVNGQGPFGNLKAEGFKLINKGAAILLTGKSKLVIYPAAINSS